jgi:alpha-L-rhamnosidase
MAAASAAILAGQVSCTTVPQSPDSDQAWVQQAHSYVLTPNSDRTLPAKVVRTERPVANADALLAEDGTACRLTYEEQGPKPVIVLDFGKQGVGGYAVFRVLAKSGTPVVRLAYACHPDGLSETGDFTRETSARYLGPDFDLPVLPGNINRHETYTIPRTGVFIAPLIQGQTRYVRVQLDTPGTSVDLDAVAMVNRDVYDRSPTDGAFLCSDERLNKLWAISTWTLQIASFPNHDAWKTVDGWLLPRKLEMGEDIGLSVPGQDWGDVCIETVFEIRRNPHHVSAAGLAFRARDAKNAYLVELGLDGAFQLVRRRAGVDEVLSRKQLAMPLVDGMPYRLKVAAVGSVLTTELDGVVIDETRDDTFATGRVGFYTPKEKWPLFGSIRVTDGDGKVLLADDFAGDLSQWAFARTLSYVADGAKRDRLVWSGDLYFAQPSAYYGSAHPTYMRDSLKMLALNQTPEGYVHASPYPERSTPPPSGDYGPFPSDEFAAWLVPVAWEHLLYTGDTQTMREIWPAIERLLDYLRGHMGANGLFAQRPETSKHAGNLKLGDTRTRSYMNILLWGTFTDAARIADQLGLAPASKRARQDANAIRQALYAKLWDDASGYFREALETPKFGPEANALAMSMGLVTKEQALRIAPHFQKIGHGKFQSLASRGRFNYGLAESGLQTLFDHNWLKLLDPGWQGAWTTTECMGMITKGWGDESHPDTAIAGHFSAFLLGVRPTAPGYARFVVRPQPTRDVRWAKGIVPTPHGPIRAEWECEGTAFRLSLDVPKGTVADVVLPAAKCVLVDGKEGTLEGLPAGSYSIEMQDVSPDAWTDPTAVATTSRGPGYRVRASSSHEAGGFSSDYLLAPADDTSKKGYSSGPHPAAAAEEWLEIDLGEPRDLAKIVLEPRVDTPAASGAVAGFPRSFTVALATKPGEYKTVATYTDLPAPDKTGITVDLYTVIGYPSARFVRIAATTLGEPARDEAGVYRLQLRRLRIESP